MHINYDTNTTYLLYWLIWIMLSSSTRPPYGRVVIVLSDPNAFGSADDTVGTAISQARHWSRHGDRACVVYISPVTQSITLEC